MPGFHFQFISENISSETLIFDSKSNYILNLSAILAKRTNLAFLLSSKIKTIC